MVKKSGGEVIVKALTAGNYDIDVYAEPDEQGYTKLGQLNLTEGDSLDLPLSLPFDLPSEGIAEEKFSLSGLGNGTH